jgi:hypothetical protein
LFTAQGYTDPEEVVQFVPRKVTDGMNQVLDAPFTAEEVEKALSMMRPNKAPRLDRFTTGFFPTALAANGQ